MKDNAAGKPLPRFIAFLRVRNPLLDHRLEYLLALYFSASTVLGFFFDRNLSFAEMGFRDALLWILISLALTEPVRRLLRLLCRGLAAWARKERAADSGNGAPGGRNRGFLSGRPFASFLFSLAVILACWLPVFLAYWPGLWNYDPWQADQVITGVYSRHHPLLHTLLLGHCYRLALAAGRPNLAPILYSAVQGVSCAAVFALACALIRQKTRSTVFFVLALLFFALFPVHPVLAMSTTKDTLFSAAILLAALLFLFAQDAAPSRKRLLTAAGIPVLALVVLLRNNAVYCLLPLVLLCLFKVRKKPWRRILAVLAAGTFLGVAADRGLARVLNASPALTAEMCSVPSQMAGRIRERVDSPDAETEAFLRKFYALDELDYDPALADGTKCCLRLESRQDLVRYAMGSLRLFLRYPAVCADSLLYTTQGLWNLRDLSHTRIYGMKNGQGYLPTDIKSGYGITADSRLPFLKSLLEKLLTDNAFLKVPVLRFLFSPALYVDLLLLALAVMLRGRNRKLLLIPLFLFFLVLTVVLGPGILPRYAWPLMVCAPVLVWLAMRSVPASGIRGAGKTA